MPTINIPISNLRCNNSLLKVGDAVLTTGSMPYSREHTAPDISSTFNKILRASCNYCLRFAVAVAVAVAVAALPYYRSLPFTTPAGRDSPEVIAAIKAISHSDQSPKRLLGDCKMLII